MGEEILFTYDVAWKHSDTHWASRWDIYLTMDKEVKNSVSCRLVLQSTIEYLQRFRAFVAVFICLSGMYRVKGIHDRFVDKIRAF